MIDTGPRSAHGAPERADTHCIRCGNACAITLETRDGDLVRIRPTNGEPDALADACCAQCPACCPGHDRPEVAVDQKLPFQMMYFTSGYDRNRILVSLSPTLTVEEIYMVAESARAHSHALYSFTLAADLEKIDLLAAHGIPASGASASHDSYETVYYFGACRGIAAAATLRRLVDASPQRALMCADAIPAPYLAGASLGSDEALLAHLIAHDTPSTLVAFTLQDISTAALAPLADYIAARQAGGLAILHASVNYHYLRNLIPDLRATRDRIAEGHYHLLTCVNESDRLVSGPFEEMIVFTDTVSHLNAKYIIPIDAPCEKAGTVIDQFGAYKSVRGPLRRRGYPLELFFS
ncbi:MAG TPA: hypothetical protein PKJ16_13050 [Spirochaetota bacterium]|nr:hypothetical protein [Spirochaetota bacterium]HPU87943.1 hypothetical protein [Spirochaetota bacterium]